MGNIPVRVKSMHASSGSKAGFGCSEPVQLAGSVNDGSVKGLPSAFKQGALSVGSTMPKRSFSVRNVWSYEIPVLMLWIPFT